MAEKTLYYGDNLNVMREYIQDESVDVIYLDPPSTPARTTMSSFGSRAVRVPRLR